MLCFILRAFLTFDFENKCIPCIVIDEEVGNVPATRAIPHIKNLKPYTCNKNSDERPNLYYPVVNPNTVQEIWPNKSAVWRYSKDRHEQNIADNLIWWGKDGTSSIPAFKRYRHLLKQGGGTVPGTWWTHDFAGHTDEARKQLRSILPDLAGIDSTITPKPTSLIQRVLEIGTETDALILDSFAGAGTTAHAVLESNKRDKGNRRFILVEMEDYADRLPHIGKVPPRSPIMRRLYADREDDTASDSGLHMTRLKRSCNLICD